MSDDATSKTPKRIRKWTVTLYLAAEQGHFHARYDHCTGLYQNFGIVSFSLPNGLKVSARCTYVAMEEAVEA